MASIRRPHSPAKHHLLRHHHHHHHHPFVTSSPPSSPLRRSSSSSSPRKIAATTTGGYAYPHPFLFLFSRRPLPRFAAFFILGSFLGLFHFLSHLPQTHRHRLHPSSSPSTSLATSLLSSTAPPSARLSHGREDDTLLVVVTPTRARAAQAFYLSRMGQTLRLVRAPVLWVILEAGKPTPEAAAVLRRTAVMHRYVGCCDKINASSSPARYRSHQMNAALELVENHRLDGIVYFADEEGVYSLQLFDNLSQIRRFGTWPVPVISPNTNDGMLLEGPVCKEGQVVGWHTSEDGSSKLHRFHVAMSGFAFNSTMLWDPKLRSHLAWNSIRHPDTIEEGFEATTFVELLVEDESQMEGMPADCSQIMNWHVPFGSENLAYPKGWRVTANLDVIIPLN